MLEWATMSDPLSIPDDKRAGGRVGLFEKPERPWSFWILIAIIIGLNGWFDYYHSQALLLDIILVIGLVIFSVRQKR